MKTSTKILIIFLISFVIKSILNLFVHGPFIFADEPCLIQRSIHLAKNFELQNCEQILDNVSQSNAHPLYIFLIAPIYLFFKGFIAYKAILIFNALLVSSATFPLFKIFQKYLKNQKLIILNVFIILFLPHIVSMEKTLMTETVFFVTGIWLLYFYIYSLTSKNRTTLYKILTIIFSILISFARPFGFIAPLAIAANEIIISKNRRNVALIYIPIAIILTATSIFLFIPQVINGNLQPTIHKLSITSNLPILLSAFIKQINSFTIATLLVPIIIFFSYIQKPNKTTNKIRWFIISFLSLNFLISANHLFGYLTKNNNLDPGLITRYIGLSTTYIFIFALIFIEKYKKFKFTKLNTSILAVTFISLLFLKFNAVKHSLNIELSYALNTYASTTSGLVSSKELAIYLILGAVGIGLALFFTNKRKILIIFITISIITQSSLSSIEIYKLSSGISNTTLLFRDKETKVLFLESPQEINPVSFSYWRLLVMSNNKLSFRYMVGKNIKHNKVNNIPKEYLNEIVKDFDYLVTKQKLNLPLVTTSSPLGTGGIKNENIYRLK